MNERERIGKRIAELRQERNLSQRKLGEITGYTYSGIARIEKGHISVGFDILNNIGKAFGKRIDFVDYKE